MPHLVSLNIHNLRPGPALRHGVLLLCANVVLAQHIVGRKAAVVQLTVGVVFVDEEPVRATASSFLLLEPGQSVRTGRGLAEILLTPGVCSGWVSKAPYV
jgi:hypothetical protein